MPLAQSKVTAQGQISIPMEVRRRMGIEPGSTIAWDEENGKMTVRRVGKYTTEDIQRRVREMLGGKKPPRASIADMDEGIRTYIRERHARGRY